MSNPYIEYYTNQAGTGLAGFQGNRYQRGHGFFGSLWNILSPFLKFMGKKAVKYGVNVGSDLLKGNDIKKSAKKRAYETGEEIIRSGADRLHTFAQTGKGRKRGRRRKHQSPFSLTNFKKSKKSNKRKGKKKKKKSVKKRKTKSESDFFSI